MFLTRISVKNPVFATMMMLALVVLGAFSYQRMAVELFPNIEVPIVLVQTSYPGAAPETVEVDVSRRIEDAVNTVNGVEEIVSRSYQGLSYVIIRFTLDVDAAVVAQDVRDRVAAIEGTLPESADRPLVRRFDPDAIPVVSLAVTSDRQPLRDLTALVNEAVVPRLAVLPGVGQVTVVGGSERQIDISVDRGRLQALGVGVSEIIAAVRSANQDVPVGAIVDGTREIAVVVEGRLEDPLDFRDLIVARRGGAPIRLSQVATVTDGEAERTSIAMLNGRPALAIDIVKVSGENTIAMVDAVEATIARLRENDLPADVDIIVMRDDSLSIRQSLADVQATVIEGAALAVLIVFLFLNSWRSTVITGLALPVSVIGTLTAIYFLGFTINVMTLMALSLVIGILIDDAIVVRENIVRHLAMGKSHRRAALDGTDEIGLAVLAATLSIVAVFLPVAFMGGIIGEFSLQFGVTVSVAIMLSLFVSFTLDPMLSSVWYDPAISPKAERGPIGRLVQRFDVGFEHFTRRYGDVLRFALRHRLMTVICAVGLFIVSIAMVPVVGVEFVPPADLNELDVRIEAPVGSSVDYTAEKTLQVVSALEDFPEIRLTYATVGGALSNSGNIYVGLTDTSERRRSAAALLDPIRQRLAAIPGLDISVFQLSITGDANPIQINILGPELSILKRLSDDLAERLRQVPGTVDVASSLGPERDIITIDVRRELASDLGVSVQTISSVLGPLLAGSDVTRWQAPDGDTYNVMLRLPRAQRDDPAVLAALMIPSQPSPAGSATVPLGQVAEITTDVGSAEIVRQDLQRRAQVSAKISGRTLGEVNADVRRVTEAFALPAGYRFTFGGETDDLDDSLSQAQTALFLAVVFIYLLLASQLGSFLQPVAIMVSLPLSLIGVLIGLLVTGSTLNMFSAIGFIMLMGLVTKNAILLVDFANQRHVAGVKLDEALVAAGMVRLRPIMMTSLATIFGMLPLALGIGAGGAQRAPMAHAIIGGFTSSTLLTLVVVPVILTYLDAFGARMGRLFPPAPDEAVDAAPDSGVDPEDKPRNIVPLRQRDH